MQHPIHMFSYPATDIEVSDPPFTNQSLYLTLVVWVICISVNLGAPSMNGMIVIVETDVFCCEADLDKFLGIISYTLVYNFLIGISIFCRNLVQIDLGFKYTRIIVIR